MKGSKVKNSIIILSQLLYSLSAFPQNNLCFEKSISIYCEDELEGMKSLSGHFYFTGNYYEFSARRSFESSWCNNTLKKLERIMQDGEYCVSFEEDLTQKELTIQKMDGQAKSWSYFQ